MELMYTSILILLLTSLIQIIDGSLRIHNWTLLLTLPWMWIMNSRVMVLYMKDLGDIVDSWIYSHPHAHLLDSWNKLLEVVEDSSKWLK